MKENLISILSTFGYKVMLQGSLLPKQPYPDSFFTFWNDDSSDQAHYDNQAISYVWRFTVYFYSTNPELVNTVLLNAKDLLKQNGWIVSGKGYDVATDEPTHTGRAIDLLFLELEE